MASALQNLSRYDAASVPSAENFSFGIVVSAWNPEITEALYTGCFDTLVQHGADPEKIFTMQVPGSFELPVAARLMNGRHNPDAIICLGCVIRGETRHDEYINQAVATGLINLGIASGKPFIFGVITAENLAQAQDRAGGAHGNKGVEAAVTAIRMAALRQGDAKTKRSIGFSS